MESMNKGKVWKNYVSQSFLPSYLFKLFGQVSDKLLAAAVVSDDIGDGVIDISDGDGGGGDGGGGDVADPR